MRHTQTANTKMRAVKIIPIIDKSLVLKNTSEIPSVYL